MPSPFPGMDPYLEDPAFWPDFHSRFLAHCADWLGDRLPGGYEARVNERLRLLEMPSEREKQLLPDIAVIHDPMARRPIPTSSPGRGLATLEPVVMPMPETAEVRDVWIEIFHRPERSLVTVIELLSPTNKTGIGFGEYMARRRSLVQQHIHLVELDLLVGGERLPFPKRLPRGDYYAYVSREEKDFNVEVYYWSVRDKLPQIPVPLRRPDPDFLLDLAALVNQTYERGHYARSLRYDASPPGPLAPEDVAWAQQKLHEARAAR